MAPPPSGPGVAPTPTSRARASPGGVGGLPPTPSSLASSSRSRTFGGRGAFDFSEPDIIGLQDEDDELEQEGEAMGHLDHHRDDLRPPLPPPPEEEAPRVLSFSPLSSRVTPPIKLECQHLSLPGLAIPYTSRSRLEKCALECSEVIPAFLFVGGARLARDLLLLKRHGITHILNCAGPQCSNAHEGQFIYKRVDLYDEASEDLTWFIYDVFDFLRNAEEVGGSVLIHCSQGVSRSCSFAIAWLMYRANVSFSQAISIVRNKRSVCEPNLGFICALMEWEKRHSAVKHLHALMYRTAYHTPLFPEQLLLKMCFDGKFERNITEKTVRCALDPRAVFIIVEGGEDRHIHIWRGSSCQAEMRELADRAVGWLQTYEGCGKVASDQEQGVEKPEFLAVSRPAEGEENIAENLGEELCIGIYPRYDDLDPPWPPEHEGEEAGANMDAATAKVLLPTSPITASVNEAGSEEIPTSLYECVCSEDGSMSWVRLAIFDDQDLEPERLLLLVGGSARFVWVGQGFRDRHLADIILDDLESTILGLASWPKGLLGTGSTEGEIPSVQLELAGTESNEFWEILEDGY
jgi:hypothetical protein